MQRHKNNRAPRGIGGTDGFIDSDRHQPFHSLVEFVRTLEHVHHDALGPPEPIAYHIEGRPGHTTPDGGEAGSKRGTANFSDGGYPFHGFLSSLQQREVSGADIGGAKNSFVRDRNGVKKRYRR